MGWEHLSPVRKFAMELIDKEVPEGAEYRSNDPNSKFTRVTDYTQQTLQSLEGSLDPKHFVRVHRSYVLNVRRVARLEPWGHGSKMAVLHDGRTVPVSRSGEARLKAVLGV